MSFSRFCFPRSVSRMALVACAIQTMTLSWAMMPGGEDDENLKTSAFSGNPENPEDSGNREFLSSSGNIIELPDEIVHCVCSFMELKDIYHYGLASQRCWEGATSGVYQFHREIGNDKEACSGIKIASITFNYAVKGFEKTKEYLSKATWIESLGFRAGLPDFSLFAGYTNLTKLDLCGSKIDAEGINAVATSPYLTKLTSLVLIGDDIGDGEAKAIAESSYLVKLTSLDLTLTSIGAEGAKAIATSQTLSNLTELNLGWTKVNAEGAKFLAASPYLTNLTKLNLGWNGIGPEGAKAIAESQSLSTLKFLDLYENAIENEGAVAIATSPHLKNLTSLNLEWNNIDEEIKNLLKDYFGNNGTF